MGKMIQENREAETLPFLWIPGVIVDPSEDASIHQKRTMVVSVKSVLLDDVSGEGKVTDYSREEWPTPSMITMKFVGSNNVAKIVKKKPVKCIYYARDSAGTRMRSADFFMND